MFKLENYITPILLSYVDKYIKNFRPEDSQVSLWGGDATFHNLDLRLEVLEQELHLPFSFVSGHIHELLIHVPWTKLASEPIKITINTIECILKLRTAEESSNVDLNQAKEKQRKSTSKKQEVETPPGYVQSLINKIVSNIKIYCNNLILKYVEEDIVVSMNVKLLTFESADENWEPAYIDVSATQVTLRKLINISDLTICLDKRNAAGKIDVYQEPVLYRCSLVMRILRQYHSAFAKRSSTTRFDVYCSSMEFSMTEQQVPMLLRVLMLLFALQQKQLKPEPVTAGVDYIPSGSEISEMSESSESWAGWAWSFVPSILPSSWDEDWNQEQVALSGHTVHIGFYVDYASLTFKVCESSSSRGGYYAQRKLEYLPLLTLRLQGLFCETVAHGVKWFHCTSGISQATLFPIGQCSCSHIEINDEDTAEYLKAGLLSMVHKSDSLFDPEAVENKGQQRMYNTSWEFHMLTVTESSLLERTPAFASDYLYQLEVPDDISSERLSEFGSDLEYSNFYERSLLRIVIGPLRLRLCSGFFHRINSLRVASSSYDYQPYSIPKADSLLSDLPPPCAEDFDALSESIPTRSMQFTVLAPVVELELLDHPYFEPTKGNLYKKRKKISSSGISSGIFGSHIQMPKITLECQCIDVKFSYPMYVKRLVHTVCQLPDAPKHMFEACHIVKSFKIIGICSRLILSSKKHTTILTPSSATYASKTIIKPHYWNNPDVAHEEIIFQSESVAITGTKPKLMVIVYILDHLYKMDGQDSHNLVTNNTLLKDASRSYGMPYLELCVEGLHFKKVSTNSTVTVDASLELIKAFMYEPLIESGPYVKNVPSFANLGGHSRNVNEYSIKDNQQVLFISGPEMKEHSSRNDKPKPLLKSTIQYPLNPEVQLHPPMFVCNIQETKICIDPLLCKWLLYQPRIIKKSSSFDPHFHKNYNISEASGSIAETPRKPGTPHESIHSSSDRDPNILPPPIKRLNKQLDVNDIQDTVHDFLNRWFIVLKSMLLSIEISQCTVYFPVESLSAIGSQGIQEAVDKVLNESKPPDMFVITLPFATIFSAAQRESLAKHMAYMPIKLPPSMWTNDKSGFPWIIKISEMSCYTLQNKKKLHFLKPLSVNVTIGVSAKSGSQDVRHVKSETSTSSSKEQHEGILKHLRNSDTAIPSESERFIRYIGSLGICVHVDMTSINIAFSEVQVCLLASILYGLLEVLESLLPDGSSERPKSPEVLGWSSQVSPTLIRESTLDSISEKSPPIIVPSEVIESDSIKLTVWIQWTIARFQLKLYSHDVKDSSDKLYMYNPNIKLVFDAEDIVSSVDFQSVYLKVKTKIASANIQHFKLKRHKEWVAGEFLGIVMRTKEDTTEQERQEDNGFVTITITRASSQHTHALWGTLQKHKLKEGKINTISPTLLSPSRYITEIVITSQPIDIVLSLSVLKNFYMVFEPLMDLPSLRSQESKQHSDLLLQVNNQNLPLVYLECQSICIMVPSVELSGKDVDHDVCSFQIETIKLVPTAVNPICRTPCRPDIYQLAAQCRILNIPGSEVEDRQYQLDVTGISLNTGSWRDLTSILNIQSTNFSHLRTMSENPALEWNNLDQGKFSNTPHLNSWPVVSKFNLSIIVAPAMIYKTNTLICGHSFEVNCDTDVNINVSLSQIKLASVLFKEFCNLFQSFLFDELLVKRPKIIFPYPKFDFTAFDMKEEEVEFSEVNKDSGIETLEILSTVSAKSKNTSATQTEFGKSATKSASSDKSYGVFPRPPNPPPAAAQNIPIDLLITGGKITMILYNAEKFYGKAKMKKDKKHKLIQMDLDKERGYDASEEGSIDEKHISSSKMNRFQPLLYLSLSQPNAFLSRFYLGRKIQLSCFDVSIKISGSEYVPRKLIPVESDFPINLLETKSGMPHPVTGILPAFFTLKWSRGIGKPTSVEIDIARPTKILCSVTRWNYLIAAQKKIVDSFRNFESVSETKFEMATSSNRTAKVRANQYLVHKVTETYTKFKEIKQKLYWISNLNVKLAQLVLSFKTDSVPELNLSISKLSNTLTLSNRPEKLVNVICFENLTVGVFKDGVTNLLLNPWTISTEISLFWEAWQSVNSDPQIQVSVNSDCIVLDVSSEHIKCVEVVLKDLIEFYSSLSHESSSSNKYLKVSSMDKEQYYKDDLRAGAFQFIDASSHSLEELPLPYQVMFWKRPFSAMAWRYPQPRALTKVRVFPVPFKTTSDGENDYHILCNLEYWSECHGSYRTYTQFYLSESEVNHLDLPKNYIQSVACVWRVVLVAQSSNAQPLRCDPSKVLVSPRALAACMRIDSYFNKLLIPDLTLALDISTVNISLHNSFEKLSSLTMPKPLELYTCDTLVPERHCFLSFNLNNIKAYLATWNFEAFALDITNNTKCSLLDYSFLTQQTLIESFSSKVEINLFDNITVNVISEPINLKFGPSVAHTLAVSLQMWEQSWNSKIKSSEQTKLTIMTRYVICNNTNINLRFGQTSTEEDILLPTRYCHLYCWRSQKSKQNIRVAVEENGWSWSRPFQIDAEGTEMCEISSENKLALFVTVKSLSSTQKEITFSGQILICNMLLEHFELKVVPVVQGDREKEFKKAPSHLIPGRSTPPSLLVNTAKKYHLRLRFFGLESAWSGDIPLSENPKCTQPWLVKVPLQERGHFLSIWCRIVTTQFSHSNQILAILWPLFMIRSNLPVSTKVHIETSTLNVHIESNVSGKGEYQQLYCPGTIDHSHQLTFQIDGGSPSSNPYVPLNYSLVDQREFFKKSDKETITDTLKAIEIFNKTEWPFFDDTEGIDWIAEEQPLTHVQIRYRNACEYSCALLVELIPWSLLVNVLGCPIAIIMNEKELCRVCHHGIITTPKLEETFHIGVGINGTWNVSGPLELTKSEWAQSFYMPKITGTIPVEGSVKTNILCNKHICIASIISSVVNEVRLLKVCSSHVLTNFMALQMNVICIAVPETATSLTVPKDVEMYLFTIAPNLNKSNAGVSIMQWFLVGPEPDLSSNFALYICLSLNPKYGWSCPVRVDQGLIRRSIAVKSENGSIPIVLTAQDFKGQTYLSLHNDHHPQIFIENKSGTKLFFAEASSSQDVPIVADSNHLNWICSVNNLESTYYTMPCFSEKFSNFSDNDYVENLVIAVDKRPTLGNFYMQSDYQWSTPICITNNNDQFVRIPAFGDVKITIVVSVYTVFLTIDSASQVEINARDIRVRLFQFQSEINSESKLSKDINMQICADALVSSNHLLLLFLPIKRDQVNIALCSEQARKQRQGITNIDPSSSDTTASSNYYSSENILGNGSETSLTALPDQDDETSSASTSYGFRTLPTLREQSTANANLIRSCSLKTSHSDSFLKVDPESAYSSLLTPTMPMRRNWKIFKVTAFFKGIVITLISDLNCTTRECSEVANLCFDDIAITALQRRFMEFSLSIAAIQLDNQMYTQGGFDYPVVLSRQEARSTTELISLNTSINNYILHAQRSPLISIELDIQSWTELGQQFTGIENVRVKIQPIAAYIEDAFFMQLKEYFVLLSPTNLILWNKRPKKITYALNTILVGIPEFIIWESLILAQPVTLQSLSVEPLSILISIHWSVKLYIALDQSPLQFGRFERKRLLTTSYRLGHALTMHYINSALFRAGWVVGSIELLGNPGGLARAMGTGFYDFVNLPYQGLVQGPWAFLRGITSGSASLMKHVTAGTLQSVTNFASSVARNLDRLTLDEEHLRRTEENRRQRPSGIAQGFIQGLTGLGISLLGAVGGIAHHPIQSVMSDGASPRGLAAGVGLGLVGVLTKPLSGAADLVALTGQGLLQGAGWNTLPEPRVKPSVYHIYASSNSLLKYAWKFMETYTKSALLFVTDATYITKEGQYEGVALVLTTAAVIIINTDQDVLQRIVGLSELSGIDNRTDPTLLLLKISPPCFPKTQDESCTEMDPACRARVVDYVRSTGGLLRFPDNMSPDVSDVNLTSPNMEGESDDKILKFYVDPQSRNYFLNILLLANQQKQNHSFSVF